MCGDMLRVDTPPFSTEDNPTNMEKDRMFDVLLAAAVIDAAGWIGYQFGKGAGYEEAQAEFHGRRRYAGDYLLLLSLGRFPVAWECA